MRRWQYRWCKLVWFVREEALSCLFPGVLFLTFGLTKWVARDLPHGIYRYDLILLVCLTAQWGMYRAGLETKDELKVIAVFHLLGLLLEIYKTQLGCWSYPERGLTRLFGVPLYSGFMYASVASYLCQAWRRLDARLINWPSPWLTMPLVIAIYLNFFTEHVLPDARWLLIVLILLLFRRTRIAYDIALNRHRMPLSLAFLLIGTAVWGAENIATRLGAWQYPDQHHHWQWVHWEKISSWSLLVILTFLIVAQLKRVKSGREAENRHGLHSAAPCAVFDKNASCRDSTFVI